MRVLGIASGKGGVGKSTIAVFLSVALARSGSRVGILDADLYGPDVPRMLGLSRTAPAQHITVWKQGAGRRPRPVERHGLKVWSTQFLMSEDQAFTATSGLAGLLLERAFATVDWGELDWLVVDLPPGTADVQQQLSGYGLQAALVVVTPQDVAHLDAKKVLKMFRDNDVTIVGGVENMASVACPGCGTELEIFPRTPYERTIWSDGVTMLVSISMSHELGSFVEDGGSGFDVSAMPSFMTPFFDLSEQVTRAWPSERRGL